MNAALEYARVSSLSSLSLPTQALDELTHNSITSVYEVSPILEPAKSVDFKLDVLNQSVNALKNELIMIKESIAEHAKNSKFNWALENLDLTSVYNLHLDNNIWSGHSSKDLIRQILLKFRQGDGGVCLDGVFGIRENNNVFSNVPKTMYSRAETKNCIEMLKDEIYKLTTINPRIDCVDGVYYIYKF